MSFNVFDESPENQLVLKEQSQQNKVHILLSELITGSCGVLFINTLEVINGYLWRFEGNHWHLLLYTLSSAYLYD